MMGRAYQSDWIGNQSKQGSGFVTAPDSKGTTRRYPMASRGFLGDKITGRRKTKHPMRFIVNKQTVKAGTGFLVFLTLECGHEKSYPLSKEPAKHWCWCEQCKSKTE